MVYVSSMRVLISGSSGFIGSALVDRLRSEGHDVIRLVRTEPVKEKGHLFWDPIHGILDLEGKEPVDGVINLAGENIMGWWTEAKRQRIKESRVLGTRLLSQKISSLSPRPKFMLSSSAIGYYGDRGYDELSEESLKGSGFLADVCQEWEQATQEASEAGIRVVLLRMGVVLDPNGGILLRLLPLFRTGLGGPVGMGKRLMSWITLQDLISVILFAMRDERVQGPVNAVSPQPVSNAQFTQALAKALGRPALIPAPPFGLSAALGPVVREVLLSSQNAQPVKLLQAGFHFEHPEVQSAIHALLFPQTS